MSVSENNIKAIDGLQKINVPAITLPPQINLEYMRIGGKQGTLVNPQKLANTELQNGRITIKLTEPVWLYDLTIWLKEQEKAERLANHVNVRIVNSRGVEREVPLNMFERYLDCYPKDFVVELEIRFFDIKKTLLSRPPVCERVVLTGFNSEDFADFCANAKSYFETSKKFSDNKAKLIADLNKINSDIAEAEAAEIQSKNSLTSVLGELGKNQEKLEATEAELSKLEAKASVIGKQSADLEQRIQENERINQTLIDSVQDNREELESLLANKNVFMEEFSSYVEQGKGNITAYFCTGVALLCVVAFCLWRLIASAVALSSDPLILQTVSAYDLFVSRLPIAFLLGTIMVICLKMIYVLLSKVFEIHQERLLLAKLSILAKDNSFFSAGGLGIPGELVYERRVSLKMELLKEFLAGNYRGAAEKETEIRRSFDQFKEQFRKKKEAENSAKNETETDEVG